MLLDLDQVSSSIFDIAKHFDDLFQLTNESIMKLPNKSSLDGLKDVYVSLNNMMISWGNSLVRQADYLQENLVYFLKYQAKQTTSFQEVSLDKNTKL